MKVVLDDTIDTSKHLVNLYHVLPEDLRPKGEKCISASELIQNAVQYISCLKKASPIEESLTRTSNAQSKSRIIAPTSNSDGIRFKVTPSPSTLVSKTPSQTPPQQIQKPLTVMAKDPKTGVIRPLTLYPKDIVRQPGGITTIQIGQNPANQIRLASPLVNKAPLVTSAVSQNKLNVRRPVHLPKATIEDDHGLICKDGCNCAIMNGGFIDDKLRSKLWAYLKKCTKIPYYDVETFLTYTWIQDELFSLLLSDLARPTFFKLCRAVSFTNFGSYSIEKKHCILIKKTTKNLIDGMVFVKGQNYTITSILVKLFRNGQDANPLISMFLESQQDCQMTSDALMRKNYICINPFHYVNAERTLSYSSHTYPQSHNCQSFSRLLCTGVSFQTICKTCSKVQPIAADEDQQICQSPIPNSSTSSLSLLKPKAAKLNISHTEMTNEELDKEFQKMLDDLEEQVNNESEDEQGEDMPDDLKLELEEDNEEIAQSDQNSQGTESEDEEIREEWDLNANGLEIEHKIKGKKRPLEDSTNIAQEPNKDDRGRGNTPEGIDYQCWQCLIWFETKDELKTHSCLNELNITGNIMFTCHFCATCSDDIDELRPHVAQCKKFNLGPLKCFLKYESAMTSTVGSIKDTDASRSTRTKKIENRKCDSCGALFPSKSELVLHKSVLKCKSFTCVKCQKNYANEKTLEQHVCSNQVEESCIAQALGKRVDQDIKVIKLDRNKISHQPAKCVNCNNLLQSYELLKAHQTLSNFCGTCKQKFDTMCDLIQHSCQGPPPPPLNPPKRIKIKSEAKDYKKPVIVLKNIEDGAIPLIVDLVIGEEMPLSNKRTAN